MRRWKIRALLVCLAVYAAPATYASCVWFADDDAIHRVDTDSNQIVASARLRDPHRLVPDIADCGVWALNRNERKLWRFDEGGHLVQELRVRDLDRRIDEVEHLQPDPFDGSLWLSDERRIIQVSAAGKPVGVGFNAPGSIRRLVIGLDQSLWVLGRRHVWNLDRAGNLKSEYPLNRHLASPPWVKALKLVVTDCDAQSATLRLPFDASLVRLEARWLGQNPRRVDRVLPRQAYRPVHRG